MTIEAMKQALQYIEANADSKDERDMVASLRQAIEQAEKQEPFCWAQCTTAGLYVSNEPDEYYTMPLYITPQPQREWVGLTATDWNSIAYTREFRAGAEWGERLMREKNGGKS